MGTFAFSGIDPRDGFGFAAGGRDAEYRSRTAIGEEDDTVLAPGDAAAEDGTAEDHRHGIAGDRHYRESVRRVKGELFAVG